MNEEKSDCKQENKFKLILIEIEYAIIDMFSLKLYVE